MAKQKIHPGWIAVTVTFFTLMASAGYRSAPSVLIVPLEDAFGWSRSQIALAVSINVLLFGLVAPFAAALMERFTVRKVVIKNLPFLLSDTVGFIRKLPTQLVDSFKSTLDEVREADLLLHIVFYAKIGSETNDFDIADVANAISEKLIHRHPHIYGDVVADTEEQVKANWETLKLKEGNKSVLGGVPNSLPALVKAMRIQEKARGAGFDWEEKEQVWDKVEEELGEFKETFVGKDLSEADRNEAEGELGDLIFSLVNFARFIDLNPETAVERTNRKFIKRFQHLEKRAAEMGKALSEMTLAEMDVYWEEAKKL